MNDIPWISSGKEARVIGPRVGDLRGKRCEVVEVSRRTEGVVPEVKVAVGDVERSLKAWQVIGSGLRSSHRCFDLAPGVKFFEWKGYDNNANTIVLGEGSKVIIDTGHLHLLGSLLAALDAEGLGPESFEAALYTHGHPDHFDSADLFSHAGCSVGLNPREEDYLQGVGGGFFRFFGAYLPHIKVGVSLEEGTLKIGDLELQVLRTPGHSPGSVCIYWKKGGVLCVGDMIFPGGAFGRCDFPGGSYRTLLESFDALSGIEVEHLLSGHGPAISGRRKVLEAIQQSRANLRTVVFSPY